MIGKSPTNLVAELLERQYRFDTFLTEEEKQKARARFESHFGEVDLGYSTGMDNESIDEDLANSYADAHGTS